MTTISGERPRFATYMIVPAGIVALVIVCAMALMLQDAFRVHIPGTLDVGGFTLDNFWRLNRPIYIKAFLDTLLYAALCALLDLLLGYPIAYVLVRARSGWLKSAILIITLMPLFSGDIVRSYGWLVVLGKYGVINMFATGTGLVAEPLQLLYTPTGVVIALVQYAMPVMVIILAASISHVDTNLERAASSLGASPIATFFRVTLPLTLPGILSGTITIFAWTLSAFATPQIIGGGRVQTIATLIYGVGFSNFNFPLAAALSLTALILIAIVLAIGGGLARMVTTARDLK